MLSITSDEGFGELSVSRHERGELARIGLRGGLRWDPETCAEFSLPRITLGILDFEFPCVSGGPDDELRRVYFAIESIPRSYVTYCSLSITLDTLAAWQARLGALASGRVQSAALRSTREGFLLKVSRPTAGGGVEVFVDGRQMGKDLWGHFWEFSVDTADVASLASQCAVAIRRLCARPDSRPLSAVANDSERLVRAGLRFPLVVEATDCL